MGQEIKMQGGASGVYRPEGSHTPHMVPTKPEVVKTAEGQKELWPDNPFWFGIEIETRKKRTKYESENQKMLVNVGTGVKEGLAEISQVYEVDSEAFVKVFTRFMHVFFDTSKNAQRLFEVVLWKVGSDKEKDVIYLHAKEADKYHKANRSTGYSPASFYRAIDELISKGIIARSTLPHMFWINPAIFWNGDRLRFITELRRAPEILPPEKH